MVNIYRRRRIIVVFLILLLYILIIIILSPSKPVLSGQNKIHEISSGALAADVLREINIKNRASNTGYSREQFGGDWLKNNGCDTRNIILNRDLDNAAVDNKCNVKSGVLNDPYTGKMINFLRGEDTSGDIQIDHVVALSNAWQTGAQNLSFEKRVELANDPLELLAVDGKTNMDKSNSDASEWLPPNKAFRCQYVARQIAVKQKYDLWLTRAEYNAMDNILTRCQNQMLPKP